MKRKLRDIVICGLLVALGTTACNIPPVRAEQLTPASKEYVILVDSPSTCTEILATEEGEKAESLSGQNIIKVTLTEEEAALLSREDGINQIEENISFFGSALDDSEPPEELPAATPEAYTQSEEWNLDVLGVNDSQAEQQKIPEENFSKIKIAVMDSGVAVTDDIPIEEHVNIIDENDETSVFFEDTTGHGTSVASVISAQSNEQGVSGVNPNAAVYSVKVLDDNNSSDLYTVVSGIYWCIDHGINIINMSFGTHGYSKILENAIQDAATAGILMIAAAGNNGNVISSEGNVDYPAAFKQVVAVGASTVSGRVSDASSIGKELELFAPGEEVPAAGIFIDTISVSGSSMSAPHVTGMASILWAKDPSKSSEFIRGLLNYSARHLEENSDFGNGIPDLEFALEQYNLFTDTYIENADTPLGNNTNEVQDYTDSKLYAKWSTGDHATLVINESSTSMKSTTIMATAARCTDTNVVLKNDKKFHGGQNYVLNLKYLYCVAYMMREKQNDTAGTTLKTILDTCMTKVGYVTSGSILTAQEKKGLAALRTDLETVLRQEEPSGEHLVSRCDANTRLEKAYMVIGIACHLVADTYAHRTVIEKGDITGEKVSQVLRYLTGAQKRDLQASINEYRVEFRDLKQYADDDARSNVAKEGEDDITVYPTRYSVASKSAVHGLYDQFMNKQTSFGHGSTIITAVFANSDFTHKINNLTSYASADNSINGTIRNKSTDVYRYDPLNYSGGQNDDGYNEYSWSSWADPKKTVINTDLDRYQ